MTDTDATIEQMFEIEAGQPPRLTFWGQTVITHAFGSNNLALQKAALGELNKVNNSFKARFAAAKQEASEEGSGAAKPAGKKRPPSSDTKGAAKKAANSVPKK